MTPGTTSLEHLEQNLAAACVELDEAAMADLDAVGATTASAGHPHH